MTYTINHNENFGSLEISFPTMPTPAIRNELKTRRFRWHSAKRVWYGYADENELRAALDKLIARADKIAAANRERRRFGGAELHESEQSPDIGTKKTDPEPETKFPSAAELPANLAFTYKIGNSVGQANLSRDFLFRANAATMKTVLSMVDGIEDETERKNAYFLLVCVAYYNAAENPELKARLRSISALYEAKFGKLDLPEEETENALPVASKTVTAAMKRIYKQAGNCEGMNGVVQSENCSVVCSGSHAVYLSSASVDLPEASHPYEYTDRLNEIRKERENGLSSAVEIELPDLKTVKTVMKVDGITAKNGVHHPYKLAPGLWVNPAYLVDMLEALPNAKAYYNPENILRFGVWFTNGTDCGILFPVRHQETETERKSA